jgi:membrane protein implicated in regulation of membrane protease activity
MAVSGFLLGFGGGGVVSGMLFPAATSLERLLIGGATGWGLWLVAWLIVTRMFGGAEGTSHNVRADLVGMRAQVTTRIEGAKPGMVAYEVAGQRQVLRAITDDDEPIPTGAAVRIRRVDESTALVMRIE